MLAPAGPWRPPTAGAATTELAECMEEARKSAFEALKACSATPLEEYESTREFLEEAKAKLRHAKTKAERARLRKVIEYQSAGHRKAQKDLAFCNKVFYSDRAEGNAKCQAKKSNPAAEGGSGGGGTPPGCEPGSVLCGEYCCDSNYAFCQGCSSGPICCRNGGECCPNG